MVKHAIIIATNKTNFPLLPKISSEIKFNKITLESVSILFDALAPKNVKEIYTKASPITAINDA